MGMGAGRKRAYVQKEIERTEVEKAISGLKSGKAAGIDGITPEMLKYGGEVVVEWMWFICKLAWRQKEVPEEWRNAIIVLFIKEMVAKVRAIAVGKLVCSVYLEKCMGEY